MLVFLVFASKLGLYTAALTGVGLLLHGAAAITTSRRWFLILGLGLVVAIAARLTLLNAQLGGAARLFRRRLLAGYGLRTVYRRSPLWAGPV